MLQATAEGVIIAWVLLPVATLLADHLSATPFIPPNSSTNCSVLAVQSDIHFFLLF